MPTTLGEWKARINDWMGEIMRDGILTDAINDAVESLWMAVMKANLSLMMGGPVTLSIAAASERQQLVSIADPSAQPNGTYVSGGSFGILVLYAAHTFVTDSGSETKLSPINGPLISAGNQYLRLSVNLPVSSGVPSTGNILGVNYYVGDAPEDLAKQNPVPVPFVNEQAIMVLGTPVVPFPQAPGPPSENTTGDDIFYIRKLEVPLTSGGFKKWEQTDIDSQLMQLMSRTIAGTSEFQNYCYDLVNMRQLEIRPATGIAFPSSRYFYVHKPRRLRYDNSTLPFFNFTSEPFIREKAMAKCHYANRDWDDSDKMEMRAAGTLLEITSSVAQMNWAKDQYIQPYMR